MSFVMDLVILALLAFFAWRGAAKGLVLSLCGLAAVFVAFFAAQILSDMFCVPVANIIRPVIANTLREEAAPEGKPADGGEDQPAYTMGELLASVRKNGLFEGFSDFIDQGEADNTLKSNSPSPVDALAGYLSKGIAKALLFGILFVGIQLTWFLLSHALDLAFRLPLLSQANAGFGLAFGFIKGVLLIIVLVWLGQLAGLVPNPPESPIVSLFTVKALSALLAALPA